jgi:signal transduction histidine kinase
MPQRHSARASGRLDTPQRLETIGLVAAGVAHDLNNLLGIIQTHATFVLKGLNARADATPAEAATSTRVTQDAEKIREAAAHAASLVKQMLTLGGEPSVDPEVVDLNGLVDGVVKLLEATLGDHIALNVRLVPNLWSVRAEPACIEQVVMNVVINARDAMSCGGILTIETANQPGAFVCLTVSDTGTGMSGEVLARAFEPFFTTKRKGRGSGLGLVTAEGIVKESGGQIRVSSVPGTGTTVKVLLPATPERGRG